MDSVFAALGAVQARRPLVHYLANAVSAPLVANGLLAFGADVVMGGDPREAGELAGDATVLNCGTPSPERWAGLAAAGKAANRRNTPIVLDPVGVGASSFRREAVASLLALVRPTVIRLNASEAAVLLGAPSPSRGVSSASAATEEVAAAVARRYGCIAAITGAKDWVSDGCASACVSGGSALLRRVSGAGCLASGLVGACLGAGGEPFAATLAALAALAVAAEHAEAIASGPGSFAVAMIDALAMTPRPQALEGRIAWSMAISASISS